MRKKIDDALNYVGYQIGFDSDPVVCWSGGKDSQIVLWLVRQVDPRVKVAYFSLNNDSRKLAFINEMANVWDLSLFFLEPVAIDMAGQGEHIEVIYLFRIGDFLFHLGMQGNGRLTNPICAIEMHNSNPSSDLLDGSLIFHGHKSSDVDTLYGPAPLKSDSAVSPSGRTKIVYPLKDWTDQDVWDATRFLNIPQNWRRYNKETGAKLESDVFNSDAYNLCTNCIQPGKGDLVECPKVKGVIRSIASEIQPGLHRNFQAYKNAFTNLE